MIDNIFLKKVDIRNEWLGLKNKPASYWEHLGEKVVMKLFDLGVNSIPAYKDYLKKKKIDISGVKSLEDFTEKIPTITKKGYLKKYKYQELFPTGTFYKAQTFSATSGSSGKPFFLPRGDLQDWQYEYIAETILVKNFNLKKKKTLAVIGFGLGIWIGGIFTYKVFDRISSKGYDLSIMPIGPNKKSILDAIKVFGKFYDHVILCGYPPFIKDLIDEGERKKIKWGNYNVKLYTAAEGVPEEFESYLIKKLKIKNRLTDITNIYGSVELGTMAYETPLSNLIKHIVRSKPKLSEKIFGREEKILTLAQYYPHHIYFESIKGKIVVTGAGSSIPLIRYEFPDIGDVIYFDDMLERFKKEGLDLMKIAKEKGIMDLVQNIPFVAVYGRSDRTVSFVGIIIYSEYVKPAFFHSSVEDFVTGKFVLEVEYNDNKDRVLIVNVELRDGVLPTKHLEKSLQKLVVKTLITTSTEYAYLYGGGSVEYKKKLLPQIKLYNKENSEYFAPGTKQRWIKR